jgi:hypothetical protein
MFFMLAFVYSTAAQVSYRVSIDSDKQTYRVYIKSNAELLGNRARIATSQVTLVVPNGSGANRFEATNITGKQVGTLQMIWSLNSRVDAPTENTNVDYLSFGFNGSGSPVLFDIAPNQEIEVFSFKNSGVCNGTVALFNNATDPFRTPNSKSTNPGNQITLLGFGPSNAYTDNYGAVAACSNVVTSPDLSATISGANTLTVGTASAYTIAVSNGGIAASSGMITVNSIIPAGVSYSSFSGIGWTCTPQTQSNGTTTVACSTSSIINTGFSNSVVLNVMATTAAAVSVSISGAVAGGGEVNTANNNFANTIAVNNNAGNSLSNINIFITGPATITPSSPINFSVTASNSGSAMYTGSTNVFFTLPAGMTYSGFSGTGWNCTLGTAGATTPLTCTNATHVAAGGNQSQLIINAITPSTSPNNTIVINGNLVDNNGGSVNPFSQSFTMTVINTTPNIQGVLSGPNSLAANTSGSFQLDLTNIGAGATTASSYIVLNLPAGMTYGSSTGTNWNCTANTQVSGNTALACSYTNIIASNTSATALILNLTPSQSLAGTTINITGTLSTLGDPNTINKGVSKTINIINGTGNTVNISTSVTGPANLSTSTSNKIVVNLTNTGVNSTTGLLTVNLTLPAGIDLNETLGSGWSCSTTPLTNGSGAIALACTNLAVIAPNGTAPSLTISVQPMPSMAGTTINLIGSVTTPNLTGGSVPINVNFVVQGNATPKPDLQATISGLTALTVLTPTNYSISVANTSLGATTGTSTIALTLPAGITYNSATGSNWACTPTAQANGTTNVLCSHAAIIAANSFANSLSINVTAAQSLAGTTVNITGSVATPTETNTGNNNFTQTITIGQVQVAPDLKVNVTGLNNMTAGTAGNITVNVTNIGTGTTTGPITAAITLPAGLTYNSATGNNWACSPTVQANASTALACTYTGSLQPNTVASTLTINTTPTTAIAGTSINITGTVSTIGDNVLTNNNITHTITVVGASVSPDLQGTISGLNTLNAGLSGNYIVTLANSGNGPTTGAVNTTIIVPAGMTFNNSTGTNWSCNPTALPNGSTTVACVYNSVLGSNAFSSQLTLNVTPSQSIAGTTVNITGTVTTPNESNITNNTFGQNINIATLGSPDLQGSISGLNVLNAGTAGTYVVTLANSGNASTTGLVTTTILIPAGVTYNGASGTNWSCSSSSQSGGATSVVCGYSVAIAASGFSSLLNLNIMPTPSTAGTTIILAGTVTTPNESNVNNNTYSQNVSIPSIAQPINLSVSVGSPTNMTTNLPSNITININNTGTNPSTGIITSTVILPAGLNYNSSNGSGWACTATPQGNGTTQLACQNSQSVLAGASAPTLTLNVTPSQGAGNTINIIGNITTPNLAPGSAVNININVPVQPAVVLMPNIQATINGSSTLNAGIAGNYTLTLSNTGTGATSGSSTANFILPEGLTYNSTTGVNWSCTPSARPDGSTAVACSYTGTLQANAVSTSLVINTTPTSILAGKTINITGTVNTTGGTSTNTFSQSITIPAVTQVSLSANIAGPGTVTAGATSNYVISAVNNGTGSQTGTTTITTNIPSSMIFMGSTGAGWSCSSALQGSATAIVCTTNQTIPVGGKANDLTLQLQPMGILTAGTVLKLNGTIAGGGSSDSFAKSVTVQGAGGETGLPDLIADITAPATVESGAMVNYQITARNQGLGKFAGLTTLATTLPASLTFISATGTGWSCSSAIQNIGTTLVTCTTNATIEMGSAANPVTITAKPLAFLSNGAALRVSGTVSGIGESNTDNNTYNNTIVIQKAGTNTGSADLTAVLTGPTSIQSGMAGNYQLVVSNIGNATYTSTTSTTVTLPAGISFGGLVGAGWGATTTPQTNGSTLLTITNNTPINSNSTQIPATITIIPTANMTTATPFNLAGNVGLAGDSNANNNSFGANFTVNPSNGTGGSALATSITGPSVVSAGVPSVYTIIASNNGNTPLTGTTNFAMTLPAGIMFGSYTGLNWSCGSTVNNNNATTQLNCNYAGTIPAQGAAPALYLNVIPSPTTEGKTFTLSGISSNPATMPSNSAIKNVAVNGGTGLAYADLSTTVQIMNKTPNLNSPVVVSIEVTNKGPMTANGVKSQVVLPEGLPIDNVIASVGIFDRNTRIWEIGQLMLNQSAVLTISARATVEGVNFVSNEITSSDQPDPNSKPNNQAENEDDFDRRCFSVPVLLCQGEVFNISIPATYTNITWYRNGSVISGINGNSLKITQEGSYTFISTGISCPKDGCCPIVVKTATSGVMLMAAKTVTACGSYDMRTMKCTVDGTEPSNGMSYYDSELDARNGQNPLASTIINQSKTIWVRYQPASGCYSLGSVAVTIDAAPATPAVGGTASNMCPATSVNLTNIQPKNTANIGGMFEWHTSNSATSPMVTNTTAVTGGTYYLFEKSTTGCYSAGSNAINVNIVECCKSTICIPFTMKKAL